MLGNMAIVKEAIQIFKSLPENEAFFRTKAEADAAASPNKTKEVPIDLRGRTFRENLAVFGDLKTSEEVLAAKARLLGHYTEERERTRIELDAKQRLDAIEREPRLRELLQSMAGLIRTGRTQYLKQLLLGVHDPSDLTRLKALAASEYHGDKGGNTGDIFKLINLAINERASALAAKTEVQPSFTVQNQKLNATRSPEGYFYLWNLEGGRPAVVLYLEKDGQVSWRLMPNPSIRVDGKKIAEPDFYEERKVEGDPVIERWSDGIIQEGTRLSLTQNGRSVDYVVSLDGKNLELLSPEEAARKKPPSVKVNDVPSWNPGWETNMPGGREGKWGADPRLWPMAKYAIFTCGKGNWEIWIEGFVGEVKINGKIPTSKNVNNVHSGDTIEFFGWMAKVIVDSKDPSRLYLEYMGSKADVSTQANSWNPTWETKKRDSNYYGGFWGGDEAAQKLVAACKVQYQHLLGKWAIDSSRFPEKVTNLSRSSSSSDLRIYDGDILDFSGKKIQVCIDPKNPSRLYLRSLEKAGAPASGFDDGFGKHNSSWPLDWVTSWTDVESSSVPGGRWGMDKDIHHYKNLFLLEFLGKEWRLHYQNYLPDLRLNGQIPMESVLAIKDGDVLTFDGVVDEGRVSVRAHLDPMSPNRIFFEKIDLARENAQAHQAKTKSPDSSDRPWSPQWKTTEVGREGQWGLDYMLGSFKTQFQFEYDHTLAWVMYGFDLRNLTLNSKDPQADGFSIKNGDILEFDGYQTRIKARIHVDPQDPSRLYVDYISSIPAEEVKENPPSPKENPNPWNPHWKTDFHGGFMMQWGCDLACLRLLAKGGFDSHVPGWVFRPSALTGIFRINGEVVDRSRNFFHIESGDILDFGNGEKTKVHIHPGDKNLYLEYIGTERPSEAPKAEAPPEIKPKVKLPKGPESQFLKNCKFTFDMSDNTWRVEDPKKVGLTLNGVDFAPHNPFVQDGDTLEVHGQKVRVRFDPKKPWELHLLRWLREAYTPVGLVEGPSAIHAPNFATVGFLSQNPQVFEYLARTKTWFVGEGLNYRVFYNGEDIAGRGKRLLRHGDVLSFEGKGTEELPAFRVHLGPNDQGLFLVSWYPGEPRPFGSMGE